MADPYDKPGNEFSDEDQAAAPHDGAKRDTKKGLGAKALEAAENPTGFVKELGFGNGGEAAALSKVVGAAAPGGAVTAKLLQMFIKGRHAKRNSGGLGLLIAGAAAAAMLVGVGTSQPAAFLKIAADMGSLFNNSERAGDNRLGKLFQYARNGTPERNRLSIVGNKVADSYEKKLNASGVTLNYDGGRTGRLRSITIDTKAEGGQRAVEKLKQQGYPSADAAPDSNGRVTVDLSENGGFGNTAGRRIALASMVGVLDMNKVSTAMASRILKTRGGVDFHPLKNAARAADEKYTDWKEKRKAERAKSIETGEPISDPRTQYATNEDGVAVDENGNPINDSEATDAKNQIEKGIKDANDTQGSNAAKGFKVRGAGATALLGAVCTVHEAGNEIKASKWTKIIQPLIRFGMSYMIIGNQLRTGQDVSPDELDVVYDSLYDPGQEDDPSTTDVDEYRPATSFNEAASYRGVLGDDVSDITSDINEENTDVSWYDMPANANPGAADALPVGISLIYSMVDKMPGGAAGCNFVNSPAGGIITAGIGIVLTGVPGAGQAAAIASSVAAAPIMAAISNIVIGWLSGSVLDIAHVAGAPAGNYLAFGTRLAANENEIARGGGALSKGQSAQLNEQTREIELAVLANQSTYEKYFNLENTDSILSKTAFAVKDSALGGIAENTASLLSFNLVTNSVANIMSGRANAENTYDFGFPEYGFEPELLDSSEVEDPYANANLVEPRLEELNDRYGDNCFGTTINPETLDIETSDDLEGGTIDYRNIEENCKVSDSDRSDAGSDFNRYRIYILDLKAAYAAACYEGVDDNACVQIGMSDPVSAAPEQPETGDLSREELIQPSDNVDCAEGTQDKGVETGYYNGDPIEIRLCAVPGIASPDSGGLAIVNSRVSGVWRALAQKMTSDNHVIRATSSWRSMADQTALYNANPTNAAKPGTSNHQLGLAIDFQVIPNQIAGGRLARPPSDPDGNWAWLNENAKPLGLDQLSDEFWHWEPKSMAVN